MKTRLYKAFATCFVSILLLLSLSSCGILGSVIENATETLETVTLTTENCKDYLLLQGQIASGGTTIVENEHGGIVRYFGATTHLYVNASPMDKKWKISEEVRMNIRITYFQMQSNNQYDSLSPINMVGKTKVKTIDYTLEALPTSGIVFNHNYIDFGLVDASSEYIYNYVGITNVEVLSISGALEVPCCHSWNAGTVSLQPTCYVVGTRTFTCTKCEKTKQESIPVTEHNYPATPTTVTPATCTKAGSKVYTCTLCGDKKTTTLDALGHEYDKNNAKITPATCIKAGVAEYTCTRCKESIRETLKALGHSFVDYKTTAATCTADAFKTAKCDRCEETDTVTEIGSALGHTYGQDGKCIRCKLINPGLKVTSIEVTNSSLMLEKDKPAQLAFAVYPQNAVYEKVTYRILQNTCGATVSSIGLLQATKVGRVTVAITIDDEITTRATFYVPQMITTAEEFYNIRNDLSGVYMLANDIDLSQYANWTPIGNATKNTSGQYDYTNAFKGTLDGNGFTVSGLNINLANQNCTSLLTVGLFGSLGREGAVSNLVLKDVTITGSAGTTDYVGALVGFNAGTVNNSSVSGTLTLSGPTYIGGAIGENIGSLAKVKTNIAVTATGSKAYLVGGVVGRSTGGQVSELEAKGSVSVSSSAAVYVGGIAGNLVDKLENATVDVDVTLSSSSSSYSYAGVLAGAVSQPLNGIVVNGSLTVQNAGKIYAGGVAGYAADISVTNCENRAAITVNRASSSGSYIGGIVGYTTKKVENCKNHAKLQITEIYGGYVGGIAASCGAISNCINLGEVYAKAASYGIYAGGVAGYASEVKLCENHAPVTSYTYSGSINYVGGVVGYTNGLVDQCKNNEMGALSVIKTSSSSSNYRQYIGGVVGYAEGAVSKSYGHADVNIDVYGIVYGGGVVGYCKKNVTTISHEAKVTVKTNGNVYAGGAVGYVGGNAATVTANGYSLTVTSNGIIYAGGTIGNVDGNASDIRNYGYLLEVTSSSSMSSPSYIGGVIGMANAAFSTAYNTANLSVKKDYVYLGGIAGYVDEALTSAHTTGSISLQNSYSATNKTSYIGGVVGYANAEVKESKATGSEIAATTANNVYVGGVAGSAKTITSCYSYPKITSSGSYTGYVGGVAGLVNTVTKSYATSRIAVTNIGSYALYAGGLVGKLNTEANECYATGDVSGVGAAAPTVYAAGLIAYVQSNATVKNSYAARGWITTNSSACQDSSNITVYNGGLVAYNRGTVENCYTVNYGTSVSNGSSNNHVHYIGGLVGHNSGTVRASYVWNAIDKLYRDIDTSYGIVGSGAAKNFYAGGFAGYNSGTLENAYSEATVNTTVSGAYTGGFVGCNASTVRYAIAYGAVNSGIAGETTGGFAGGGTSGYSACFFDQEKTLQSTAVGDSAQSGVTAATSASLRSAATFSSFSKTVWSIADGSSPTLVFASVWDYKSDGFNKYNMLTQVPNASEQYAFPHQNRVTVSFDVGGSGTTSLKSLSLSSGDKIYLPILSDYTANGKNYIFFGWFTDKEYTKSASGLQTVTASTTYYANFREKIAKPETSSFVYDATEHSVADTYVSNLYYTVDGTFAATDAGKYTVTFRLNKNCCWADGSIADYVLTWTVKKAVVTKPETSSFVYDATEHSVADTYVSNIYYTVDGTFAATDAGEYKLTFRLNKNYCWADGSTEDYVLTWTVTPYAVSIPNIYDGCIYITYTGTARDLFAEYGNDYITATGDTTVSGLDTDEHTVAFALKDKKNFAWNDGSIDEKSFVYRIAEEAQHSYANVVCTVCGLQIYTRVDASGNESASGDYILFGSYPQSEVTDSTLKVNLITAVGTKPTSSVSNGWTSYEYYQNGSNSTDYMWYKDIAYGGERYRAVYFTSYRPYYTTNSSSVSNTYQDDNGYTTGNIYFFRYDPIKWRILTEKDGKAMLLCEMLIDSREYYHSTSSHTVNGQTVYANNYEHSNIRKWLNDSFYETAFDEYQQAIIQLTTVDNSASTTSSSSNSYACNNTQDYIFLPSYKEVLNTSYGFSSSSSADDTARQKKTTDYAQCQGAWTSTSAEYLGNSDWWLRSPRYSDSRNAQSVDSGGYADISIGVYYARGGVCPALWISLE